MPNSIIGNNSYVSVVDMPVFKMIIALKLILKNNLITLRIIVTKDKDKKTKLIARMTIIDPIIII